MIIIIGGGIAGLAAAFELHTRSVPFVLLEGSDRLGGLIRTEQVDGFTIDSGADSLLVQKPAGLQLCEELGLGSRLIASTPPRTAFVHAGGRLHALPSPSVFGIPTTAAGIAAYDLLTAAARRTLLDLAKAVSQRAPAPGHSGPLAPFEDESVGDFFRREFGPDTVALIAEPLLGGIHAGDVDRLSIASVAPRLVAAARTRGGAMRALLDSPESSPARADGLFRSLPRGMGEIVAAIEARLPAASVRLGRAATSISRANDGWQVASTHDSFNGRAVIVAAPAHAAAGLFSGLDRDIAARCADVPYVSTVSIALGWPRTAIAHPLDGSGFVVARAHSDLRITACTWASSKWAGRTPPGMALLRAFLGSAKDPGAASLPDDEIRTIAVRDASRALGINAPPIVSRIHRWMRAGAQHNVGHLSRVAAIEDGLRNLPGLYVSGSGFRSIGVPDCIADGRAAAAAAADYVKISR